MLLFHSLLKPFKSYLVRSCFDYVMKKGIKSHNIEIKHTFKNIIILKYNK